LSNHLNSTTKISFFATVYPIDTNYEETLLTLQFVDRFTTFEKVASKGFLENFSMSQDNEKMIQRLNQENIELKKEVEATKRVS
jgi:hypothetical protein